MPTELEDAEVLNIGDGEGDNTGGSLPDGTDGAEQDNDRGDDFVDPEALAAADSESGTGKEGEGDLPGADGKGDAEGNTGNIPASRLGEVARAKTASVAIGKGLVDGSVDGALIDELGGYDAVVKAIANRELSIDDLKEAGASTKQQQPAATVEAAQPVVNPDPKHPSNWNLDEKWIEYQELVEAGETKESASLIREISKEERAREKAADDARVIFEKTQEFAAQVIAEYPILKDQSSQEFSDMRVWIESYQRTGSTRIEAIKKALVKTGLAKGESQGEANSGNAETDQQRVIRLRKEASMKRGAEASVRQPPPMGLGASPNAPRVVDVADMDDEQFAAMSKEDKARARGDIL